MFCGILLKEFKKKHAHDQTCSGPAFEVNINNDRFRISLQYKKCYCGVLTLSVPISFLLIWQILTKIREDRVIFEAKYNTLNQ